MWVARDKNGSLKLVDIQPSRKEKLGEWIVGPEFEGDYMYIDRELFPELKWEDEPIEVYLNTGYNMADQINNVWAMLKCTQDELNRTNQALEYYTTKYDALNKIFNGV